MHKKWRRFEVLIPLHFNDGRTVPANWLTESVDEVFEHFKAVSFETQRVEGHWRLEGMPVRDELVKIVVDAPESPETTAWMLEYKERWRKRLDQVELWVVSYAIDLM